MHYLCRAMKTIFFPDEQFTEGAYAATVGFFDGVHQGHRAVMEHLKKEAARNQLSSMVITFERHPRQVVQKDWQPELLTTLEEKIRLIEKAGIDVLVVLRFDSEMAGLSAFDFMDKVLREALNVRLLLTGYDNRFGHDRKAGFDDYCRYGETLGIDVMAAEPVTVGTSNVSSSRIRQLLKEGEVEEARYCLGHPYTLGGVVVHGEQIGRKIGFPTANLRPDEGKLIPADGVYAVRAEVEGYQQLRGITNIGTRPTFDGTARTLETNLLDAVGNIYDRRMQVCFFSRLRGEKLFPSGEALAEQIRKDKEKVEQILNKEII